MPFQPPKFCIVSSHDSRIAGRSLAEINPAIFSNHRAIRVVVSETREVRNQDGDRTIRCNFQNPSPFEFTPFCYIKVAVMKTHAGPRSVLLTGGNLSKPPCGFNSQQ